MEEKKRMKPLSRRRFLSVCAMTSSIAALPWSNAIAGVPLHHWHGILLGAHVHLTLAHPRRDKALGIFDRCVQEIKRLENIFTLYDSHSEISQLNKNGYLDDPSPEMLDILIQARRYHTITKGSFDITIKALEEGKSPDLVSMDLVSINKKRIHFEKNGMAVTLNGIAQGYITDKITELLKQEGLTNVLVELGEKRALGYHPDNRPWLVELPAHDTIVPLSNISMATSAYISPDTHKPHIFDPGTGMPVQQHHNVCVIAKTATMADALSTGFVSLNTETIRAIQNNHPDIAQVYCSGTPMKVRKYDHF